MAKKKKVRKKRATATKKRVPRKRAPALKKQAPKKPSRKRKGARREKVGRATPFASVTPPVRKGLGPNAAGESGDVQGLSEVEEAASESVSELAEEGQDYEAEVVDGVQNAPDPDRGAVKTHEVPEDDVPPEYLDKT